MITWASRVVVPVAAHKDRIHCIWEHIQDGGLAYTPEC